MYEEFFGLQHRPFSATPDAAHFIPLEGPQGVLDALAVCCERGQGIGLLTGDAGLGKSMIGLRLAFELHPTFATVFLGHSAFPTRRALLQAILFELQRPYSRMAEQELRLELITTLKTLRPQQQALALILDEAHRLSEPLLDELRLLTMLADGSEPLTRVVLIGNRDLEERLADPKFAAFNQRVSCQVDLAPLTQAESVEYLRGCLEMSGGRVDEIFATDALTFIAKAADGVPRCLNHLADHSLLLAYVTERRPVTTEIVREALDDLKQLPLQWNDPVSGGEIYRGRSNSVTMEDSAVDLWPQHQLANASEISSREFASDTFDSSLNAFGEGSAAIEIGGDEDEPSPQEMTCLRDNWQSSSSSLRSMDDVLADVAEITETVHRETHLSAEDTLSDSPHLGKVFGSTELEFGSPTLSSFAVEEFADQQDDWTGGLEDGSEDDFTANDAVEHHQQQESRSLDFDEPSEPVWNLSPRTWRTADDFDYEEEPVIDRYVRIENGSSPAGIVWQFNAPHASKARPRQSVVTAQRPNEHSADEEGLAQRNPVETDAEVNTSGIVESYSRASQKAESSRPAQTDVRHPLDQPDVSMTRQADWHLPTELLRATLESDGIEEQIGASVLDLYLETQQLRLEKALSSERATSPEKPSLHEWASRIESEFASLSDDDVREHKSFDTVLPESPHEEPHHWDASEQPTAQPDVIQRAYGRLFSELRRRRR